MMMSYQNPPNSDEEDDTMTTGHSSNSRKTVRILGSIVVAGVLLLVVAAGGGGVVWRRPEGSSDTTTTVKGLVVETDDNPCLPATDNFVGISQTNSFITHGGAFQTCYQYGDEDKYCWTNSYSHLNPLGLGWYQCVPIGYGDEGWHAIEQRNMRYVNPPPVCPGCPYTCGESISVLTSVGGEPCQEQRRG